MSPIALALVGVQIFCKVVSYGGVRNGKCYKMTLGLVVVGYRIYSINRPGRLLNFWTLRVGTYSRWALIQGWVLIKFSTCSASVVCVFCNKTINGNNKTRRYNKARVL